MGRVLGLVVMGVVVLSGRAAADIGPPAPLCKVPSGCVTCTSPYRGLSALNEDAGLSECQSAALDAGLVSLCMERVSSGWEEHYCPDVASTPPSGCSVGAGASMLFGLAALLTSRRRK